MASIEHKVSVSVTGIAPLKELIELLHSNFLELPVAVQQALLELASDGKKVWDIDYFQNQMDIHPSDIEVYLDGEKASGVMAIWPDTCEAVTWGAGVTKHKDIQVRNAKTGEPVCGVANG